MYQVKRISVITTLSLTAIAFVVGFIFASHIGMSPQTVASGWFSGDSQAEASGKPLETDEALSLLTFRRVASSQNPTVVNIATKKTIKANESMPRGFMDDHSYFFDFFGQDFFRGFQRPEYEQQSLGSGVIIDSEGYILTNNHVIDGADEVIVRLLNDEEEYKAEVVGRDPKTDIALIKIEGAKNLVPAHFGDSDSLQVGDWVIAIGNPFGYSHTVTVGVVSALDRSIGQGPYDQFIQTDASINPGNSGGPLFNHRGEVIGINTAIATRSGGYQGVGFAIPINMAKNILNQLKDEGEVTRGWIGVMIQRVDSSLAEKFGLDKPRGALIADVVKDGPAEKSGLEVGDIIMSFDGKEITDYNVLSRVVADTAVDKGVPVIVIRDGKEKKLKLTVGKYPKDEMKLVSADKSNDIGMDLQELSPTLAERLNLPDSVRGVVVSRVQPGSNAEKAGLQRGDVITEVERKSIETVREFNEVLENVAPGQRLLLLIQRGEQSLFITVKLQEK